MLSKALTVVLFLSTSIGMSESMPKFLCLRPPFNTITKLFNGSYFVTDFDGNYWNNITEETDFPSYKHMKGEKMSYIRNINNHFAGKYLSSFEVTFKTNFDGKCNFLPEKLFGLRAVNDTTVFTYYGENKWKDAIELSLTNTNYLIDRELRPLFEKAIPELNTTKRIGAIVNFPDNGLLFIQDQKLFYVFCSSNDWQIVTENVTQDVIIFDKNYKVNWGQIFGGYVDKETNILYLFGGQLTSSQSIIRKFVHKCKIQIDNGLKSTKPSKITLFCEKLIFKKVCAKPVVDEGVSLAHHITMYGLIVGVPLFIILVIILIILAVRRSHKGKPKKKEVTIKPIEKKALADNRERVIGESRSTKRVLARNRTQDFSKKQ